MRYTLKNILREFSWEHLGSDATHSNYLRSTLTHIFRAITSGQNHRRFKL